MPSTNKGPEKQAGTATPASQASPLLWTWSLAFCRRKAECSRNQQMAAGPGAVSRAAKHDDHGQVAPFLIQGNTQS